MASTIRLPPQQPSNGVVTAPPKGVVGGNRKKQKRRAKQAAKAAAQSNTAPADDQNDYDEDPLGYGDEDDYEYSDGEQYAEQYASPHGGTNGYMSSEKKNSKKKAKRTSIQQHSAYNPELVRNTMPPPATPPPPVALRPSAKSGHGDIWNTSTQQERQNIKDFWLSLSEDERKSLLRIEKEAVLRKMKQQQKHSCSCTVCGRKRTAIEEELEVLYEGYYEELEQYAHHDHPPNLSAETMIPDPLQHRRLPPPLAAPLPPSAPQHKSSHLHEHFDDDEDEFSDDEEYSEDEDYSDDVLSQPAHSRGAVPDFFTFGQNLTVKDNILTVADDLLKNDGRKFIEMMEQLAERRMQRENEAEYAATNPNHPSGYPPGDPNYNHEDPLAAGDDYDDEEASYDSGEYEDDELDEADEMGGLTEEERMREGRRMFQIFAARMFEQRVLTAYKEKVAAERQRKLLEELEDETKMEAQREAKKQRDAQKKKDKKKQQQAAKAEEKARKEAEKAAEEARVREEEARKQEEQRRKKEEQRKKKEEEKRKMEEERARKELEKTRRQQEEQQRREEVERKAREQKAAEKAKKEESRKKEREEREAREKELRDRKMEESKAKKDRESVHHNDREAKPRGKVAQSQTAAQSAHASKKTTQPGMVAIPEAIQPRQPASNTQSSHPSVATPAIPKAPTPATTRQHQTSQQGSLTSSPKQSQSQVSSTPSKSSSPTTVSTAQYQQQQQLSQPQQVPKLPGPPKVLQKPGAQQHAQFSQAFSQPAPGLTQQVLQPPPGMTHPTQLQAPFAGGPPAGYPGFPLPQQTPGQSSIGSRNTLPMYPPQGNVPMQAPNRFVSPSINGPPGMLPPPGRLSRPFDAPVPTSLPPGFTQPHPQTMAPQVQTSPIGSQAPHISNTESQRLPMQSHSRHTSLSDKDRFDSTTHQPIARPAPIQRPSSVKPHGDSRSDVDDLSKHLGSSALLDDSDEPLPPSAGDARRQPTLPAAVRHNVASMPPLAGFGPSGSFNAPQATWNPPGLSFSPGSALNQQSWSNLPTPSIGSWPGNGSGFAANGAFGVIGGAQMHRPTGAGFNRPLTIRLAVCQACRQLTSVARADHDGFHGIGLLLRQIEANRVPLDTPPTLREIEDICETEGDAQNGGGELYLRRLPGHDPASFSVMWQPFADTPDQMRGIGEIGSPLPNKSSLAGFGAPGLSRAPGASANSGSASIGPGDL